MENISVEYAKKLAHDLKSPLSALRVLLDLLESEDQKSLLLATIDRYESMIKELETIYK